MPPQLTSLQSLQWCKPHVRHRYMLAEGSDALYVGMIGTKLRLVAGSVVSCCFLGSWRECSTCFRKLSAMRWHWQIFITAVQARPGDECKCHSGADVG